jgi:hypothetical protein
MAGAKGFAPSAYWSRNRVTKILSALSGDASGAGPDFLPLLLVRRLPVNWVTNRNRPQISASGNAHHLFLRAIRPFCELSLKGEVHGELDLAGRPGGFADDTEARAEQGVRRQSEIHNIENVEELRAKL